MSGQRTQWNEATRVQMPALVHLTRIGFTYFGKITEDKAGTVYDPDTNILIEVFKSQFAKLNPERAGEAEAEYVELTQEEFESKMSELTSNLQSYFDEGNVLQKEIMEQLKRVKYEQI